jgi:hypothetical protein
MHAEAFLDAGEEVGELASFGVADSVRNAVFANDVVDFRLQGGVGSGLGDDV